MYIAFYLRTSFGTITVDLTMKELLKDAVTTIVYNVVQSSNTLTCREKYYTAFVGNLVLLPVVKEYDYYIQNN